ncbi:MAG: helix-turn-helix domain-containing protein [Propionibacteriaceae bacterium]|nr:helix-turn-helix domain-containing protein [Propionibacteriaceae bacterium]
MDNWWPREKVRTTIAAAMKARLGTLITAAQTKIAADNPWITTLDAENRSWISAVAQAGITGLIDWFQAAGDSGAPTHVFSAAPPALTRKISLEQTVDLVRSTVDALEKEITTFEPAYQAPLQLALLHYAREIAFAAAQTYARAAETRGAWDARLESLVVDAVIRGKAGIALMSQASTLGWTTPEEMTVVIGTAPAEPIVAIERIRKLLTKAGAEVLASQQGQRLVVIIGGTCEMLANPQTLLRDCLDEFGTGNVVIGPKVSNLEEASRSAADAMSGLGAAKAWSDAPRLVPAAALLPERVLAGDANARSILVETLYKPLVAAGAELVATVVEYLNNGGSIEAAARTLFIHPNTVRYRLKRIQEITSMSPVEPRDGYAFRLAISLGKLQS